MKTIKYLGTTLFLHENDEISNQLYHKNVVLGQEVIHEDHLVNVFNTYINDGDVIIDGGAHLGLHTIKLSQLTPSGHVYAFEASPRTYDKLQQTLLHNSINNVTLTNNALYSEATNVYIEEHIHADQDTILFEQKAGTRQVTASTIDALMLPRLDFIKLDIEGGEYSAIVGAEVSIKKHFPIIVYELLPHTSTDKNPTQLLENWGYTVYQLYHPNGSPHWDYLAIPKHLLDENNL